MAKLSPQRIEDAFAIGDAASTSHARGQALENLIVYLLRRVPGIRLEGKDVRTADGSEEIDLLFWNDRVSGGLPFLPNILMFECKNWSDPVDSAAVAFFLNKLRIRRLEYGFLVAANGVTGRSIERTAAQAHVNRAFFMEGRALLIIERTDLVELATTDQLVRMVQRKIARLYLGAE